MFTCPVLLTVNEIPAHVAIPKIENEKPRETIATVGSNISSKMYEMKLVIAPTKIPHPFNPILSRRIPTMGVPNTENILGIAVMTLACDDASLVLLIFLNLVAVKNSVQMNLNEPKVAYKAAPMALEIQNKLLKDIIWPHTVYSLSVFSLTGLLICSPLLSSL